MLKNAAIMNTVKLRIKWDGSSYLFTRRLRNEYGELTDDVEKTFELNGIFHNDSSSHATLKIVEAAITIDKRTPQILAMWEDAKQLKLEDEVEINNMKYKVSDILNLNNSNQFGNISLEVIL